MIVTFNQHFTLNLVMPVAAVIVNHHPTVVKRRYNWPANAGPGQGPALVLNGAGKVATFQLDHQSFPL